MLEKLKKRGVLHSGCSGRGKWARGNAPKRRREEVRKVLRRTSCKKGEEVGAAVHEREEEKTRTGLILKTIPPKKNLSAQL